MRNRKFPVAYFQHSPDELIRVVCFGEAETLAAKLFVDVEQVTRWREGAEAVPFAVFAWLREEGAKALTEAWAPFDGFTLDRGRLVSRQYRAAISIEDVMMLREYRLMPALLEKQADTIERLMKERDFYKAQCHREAKFGMMVNRLFK
ncbi:hypothetical protein [Vogesella indigofera]|uniref:hypothetical protein n=1 Tax=Vogesella indigofera TaxID=45465 RepID=UPI00234EB98F|nr:hypothetical protein [Vogesella indigofera]MDC7700372.1 hypothetical protein [Vogesella indigofera]